MLSQGVECLGGTWYTLIIESLNQEKLVFFFNLIRTKVLW